MGNLGTEEEVCKFRVNCWAWSDCFSSAVTSTRTQEYIAWSGGALGNYAGRGKKDRWDSQLITVSKKPRLFNSAEHTLSSPLNFKATVSCAKLLVRVLLSRVRSVVTKGLFLLRGLRMLFR